MALSSWSSALYGQTHPNKGHMIRFLSDTTLGYGMPPIIKLNTKDFNDAKLWFHLELSTIQNALEQHIQVLPVPKNLAMVHTPKLIPIPLFLVPFFIKGGSPEMPLTPSTVTSKNSWQMLLWSLTKT